MSMDFAVESDGEEIVLYFSIDAEGVDAQTFGNALISFRLIASIEPSAEF